MVKSSGTGSVRFGFSYSHRGFSPVEKRDSYIPGTVSTVFPLVAKKTVKTVRCIRILVWHRAEATV